MTLLGLGEEVGGVPVRRERRDDWRAATTGASAAIASW